MKDEGHDFPLLRRDSCMLARRPLIIVVRAEGFRACSRSRRAVSRTRFIPRPGGIGIRVWQESEYSKRCMHLCRVKVMKY